MRDQTCSCVSPLYPGPCYDAARNKGEPKIQNRKSKIRPSRPKLGQHFLHDSRYRARILEALSLDGSDVVIEIGPGRGAMTGLLAERAHKVIAVEVDQRLAEGLHETFQDEPKVEIVIADILRADITALCRKEGIPRAFIFGNLPYYITSPILHHLFAQRECIRSMGLLMQREVADRLTSAPGSRDYGYLSVATQVYTEPCTTLAVPPGAFSPAPQVQSALVTFGMVAKFPQWPQTAYGRFLEFVKSCFAQKRKNLVNNLSCSFPRSVIVEAIEAVGKSATSRAEQLSPDELAMLFESLTRLRGGAWSNL